MPEINLSLKEENINVLCGDILYKEGILEYLEINKDIDYIIINENLEGKIKLEDLIEKIKKINFKIKIILISKNQKNYKNIYKKIENININEIKNIIFDKNRIFNKKNIPINDFFNEETKDGEIISIVGPNGIGKSIFSITYSNNLENKQILIFNLDIFNNSIINLLEINKNKINKNYLKNMNKKEDNLNIEDYIIKSKYNLDFISGAELIFNSKIPISPQRIRNIIYKLKNKYDLILIDTSSESLLDYNKEILKISDYLIFISGANLLEIKKSQKLLEIYTKEWDISNKKIKIIINKWTKQSIDDEILKEIFKSYDILGKIKLSDYYDVAINKNNLKRREIQNDMKNIRRKIIKNKRIKI